MVKLASIGQYLYVPETSFVGTKATKLSGFPILLGPVVQSIVSLTSSVVKMLTVLVSTVSNSQVFLLKKYELPTFIQQKYKGICHI